MANQASLSLLPVQVFTRNSLNSFLDAIRVSRHADSDAVALFETLASLGYRQRYALNISRFLDCFASHRVDNVIKDGFTDFELRALAQINDSGLTSEQLSVAHILLGVPERYEYLQFLKAALPNVRIRHTWKESE